MHCFYPESAAIEVNLHYFALRPRLGCSRTKWHSIRNPRPSFGDRCVKQKQANPRRICALRQFRFFSASASLGFLARK
ncbi:hypothetical protein HYPSUDRAFT_915111 [Hypholoma sublateritium FD-334 SS-4]|uniref:Uncharacterized protein n=1 Tax=Hypholoma sublateritium (strain FD-334 SS-4) TaxID=945553 RepID=A0A0D2NPN8_HYPSF|nr:hypothetical protein HYPSUDRAFT_915111 [Hypholoma sublateritium FD-334 SS-4]